MIQILVEIGEHVNEDDPAVIENARKAGNALVGILNWILDYSKLAQSGADAQLSSVDVVSVCRTVTELHTAAASTKRIDFRSHLDLPPTGQSTVLIDDVKLFEIINNLVSNALKFTVFGWWSWGSD